MNRSDMVMKLQMFVTLPVALILLIMMVFAESQVRPLLTERYEQSIFTELASMHAKTSEFFVRYGERADTFANAPQLKDWFAKHKARGADLSDDEGYKLINQTFLQQSDKDPNVYSAFFASQITGEYFRENQITGEPKPGTDQNPYYTHKRPWYIHAVYKGSYSAYGPYADLTTGNSSVVFQQPVKDGNDQVIGVAGLDIKLKQMATILEQSNQGMALMVNENGRLIHFPNNKLTATFKIKTKQIDGDAAPVLDESGNGQTQVMAPHVNHPVKDFDSHAETDGFAAWINQSQKQADGLSQVTFMGEEHYLAYRQLKLEMPQMNWTVAYLVPKAPLQQQLKSQRVKFIGFAVFAILIMALIIVFVSGRIQND